jgi:hypothetical protein
MDNIKASLKEIECYNLELLVWLQAVGCHWNVSLTQSFRSHCGPGVGSANRNEHQEYLLGGKGGRCVMLTTLPTSCADCIEIWDFQPPGTLRACPGLYKDCITFTLTFA